MSEGPTDAIDAFYSERVPAQLNESLAAQRLAAASDEDAARVLEEMEAVRASIVVRVGDEEPGCFAYDIERGEARHVAAPRRAPFMILGHDVAHFAAIRRECGDSLLGFLGALAGIGDALRLTSLLVRNLRELDGSLVFERAGHDGFALRAHFGSGEPASEPRAVIRVDAMTYARLRAGELDPQDAFLAGEIEVEGDEGMAIALALAAMAPA